MQLFLILRVRCGTDLVLGVVGPFFPEGTFEYIPINNSYGIETRTYNDFSARNIKYGRTLSDFIPSYVANRPVHFDPDFSNYTYGQPVDEYPRSRVLEKLREGDVVFFVSSLAPYDIEVYQERDVLLPNFQRGKKNKYIIGFFTVKGVARVFVFKSAPRLALALLNVAYYEEGEVDLDTKNLEEDLETLKAQGYVTKEADGYKLTRQESESSRSGQDIVQIIYDLWSESEDAQRQLLERGLLDITLLSGKVTEDIVKTSHHYKRLRSLDWDHFVLIVGDQERSGLLTHAIRLTEGFETFSFTLNELGRSILKRTSDTLRGFRWIDEKAVSALAREICKDDTELINRLHPRPV